MSTRRPLSFNMTGTLSDHINLFADVMHILVHPVYFALDLLHNS